MEKNVKMHVENEVGDTLLHVAARSKMKEVIRFLVEKGAADKWFEAFGEERPEEVVEQLDDGSLRGFVMRLGHPDGDSSGWELLMGDYDKSIVL